MVSGRVDPVPAVPPRVGTLVTSANSRVNGDDVETNADGAEIRWPAGFMYEVGPCSGGELIEIPCPATDVGATPSGTCEWREHRPFMAEIAHEDSTFGNASTEAQAAQVDTARALLLACESKLIEAELWSGTATQAAHTGVAHTDPDPRNRYLTNGEATLPEGSLLLGYQTAFAVLERALGDCMCSGPGMIHARLDTIVHWWRDGLIDRVGDLFVSPLGTIVVGGRGYDGSGPGFSAPSADSAWAFATDIVQLRRGTIVTPQSVEHADNTIHTIAQRPVAATWGCCHIGVRVDHDVALTTTGS